MYIYELLTYPDPRLLQATQPVTRFDDELKRLVEDLFATHYAQENCAALAANQLGVDLSITVIDFSSEKNQPLCLINPEITERTGVDHSVEGCMSLPGLSAKVKRAAVIQVRYQDVDGHWHEMQADGFMAKCIQHEIDHLHGKLYLSHLSSLKRAMLMTGYKPEK